MSKHERHHHEQECDCMEGECTCGEECHGECGCYKGSHFHRRHLNKVVQIADLEAYLGDLKLEVQAVEEKLTDLRN